MSDAKSDLKRLILQAMVEIHKLHFKRPFGNDRINLDVFQYRVMVLISEKRVSIQEIANMANLNRRIVISNISYLEKMGLISKEKSDGREVELVLTDYGSEILSEMREQFENMVSFIEGRFSIKEEKSIMEFLSTLCESIQDIID